MNDFRSDGSTAVGMVYVSNMSVSLPAAFLVKEIEILVSPTNPRYRQAVKSRRLACQ